MAGMRFVVVTTLKIWPIYFGQDCPAAGFFRTYIYVWYETLGYESQPRFDNRAGFSASYTLSHTSKRCLLQNKGYSKVIALVEDECYGIVKTSSRLGISSSTELLLL